MDIRKAYLAMIKRFPGGWDAIAPALGMTRDALENRIYERKGQSVLVETAMQIQAFSGTKLFAETVAVVSGGVYVELPHVDHIDNDFVQAKFNETYAELGQLFSSFTEAIGDGVIDDAERAKLEVNGEHLHRKTEELLGLMFRVYCPHTKTVKLNSATSEVAHG